MINRRIYTEEQREAVCRGYQQGHNITDLMALHGCARGTVHRILVDGGVKRRSVGRPGGVSKMLESRKPRKKKGDLSARTLLF